MDFNFDNLLARAKQTAELRPEEILKYTDELANAAKDLSVKQISDEMCKFMGYEGRSFYGFHQALGNSMCRILGKETWYKVVTMGIKKELGSILGE